MVGVLGGASYVSDLLPPDHHTQAILKNIVTSGERAAHLTRQLLAYAGKGTFVVQQVDLSGLVKQTCELIASSIPNNVQLLIQAAPDLPLIETDSGQAQQVIMNLILNAAEAIQQSEGGAIFVKTSLDRDAVVLEVRDNGCGMDTETQARIFDPFFTTKFTGRGLGLAAVQGILRSSGASIQVDSSPGSGSVFRVRFRAATAAPANSPGPAAGVRTPLFDPPATILIVDDEPTVRQICKTALERTGCIVLLAEDGKRGLQFLEDEATSIDLILLDLGMPGMDGRQVLERVRAAGITLPVIVFSGYSENEVALGFEGLSVSSFLQKPFSASRLVTRVADVLTEVRYLDAITS
jgi:CheY-like chemotaxis protein